MEKSQFYWQGNALFASEAKINGSGTLSEEKFSRNVDTFLNCIFSEGHENSPPWKMIPPLKMENGPPFHFSKNNIGKLSPF